MLKYCKEILFFNKDVWYLIKDTEIQNRMNYKSWKNILITGGILRIEIGLRNEIRQENPELQIFFNKEKTQSVQVEEWALADKLKIHYANGKTGMIENPFGRDRKSFNE